MAETKKMRVKMLSAIVGRPAYMQGEVAEVDAEVGRAWIDDGLAIAARDEKPVEHASR